MRKTQEQLERDAAWSTLNTWRLVNRHRNFGPFNHLQIKRIDELLEEDLKRKEAALLDIDPAAEFAGGRDEYWKAGG